MISSQRPRQLKKGGQAPAPTNKKAAQALAEPPRVDKETETVGDCVTVLTARNPYLSDTGSHKLFRLRLSIHNPLRIADR
jgi:hypothetical protein